MRTINLFISLSLASVLVFIGIALINDGLSSVGEIRYEIRLKDSTYIIYDESLEPIDMFKIGTIPRLDSLVVKENL